MADILHTPSSKTRDGLKALIALRRRDSSSSSLSTAPVQDDDVDVPDSAGHVEQQIRKKKVRQPGKIGSKGMPSSHPWDDNESELVMALRASGMSYNETTKADFKHWSYIGLRTKYLKLVDMPRWKERFRIMREMTDFERLEAVHEAQLAVTHSRLQRIQDKQDTKAQGRRMESPGKDGVASDDATLDNAAKGGPDDLEINKTPPQQVNTKGQYAWGSHFADHISKRKHLAPDEPPTERAKTKGAGKEKRSLGETDDALSEAAIEDAILERVVAAGEKPQKKPQDKTEPSVLDEHTTPLEKKATGNGMGQEKVNESHAVTDDEPLASGVPEIHETPDPDVAGPARVAQAHIISLIDSDDDDDDDDLDFAELLRRARRKRMEAARRGSDEGR